MAEIPQQKRQSIVLALTDHDLGSEGQVEIDVTDSNEDLTTDVDISTHGSEHGTNGNGSGNEPGVETVVQIQNEQRVSISRRLQRQKNTAKAIEDRVKQTIRDRQMMIDSLFDEHKDLHKTLNKLEVIARDKAVDDAIRIAEKERASKYMEIRELDKRIKEAIDGRQEMIQQLVAEQKQINKSIHELEELITTASSNRPAQKFFTEVQSNSPLAEGRHQPWQKTNRVDHDQNLEGGRTEPACSHIMEKQQDACSNARFTKHMGRHHADSKDGTGLKQTTMKRILPMTIMRLL